MFVIGSSGLILPLRIKLTSMVDVKTLVIEPISKTESLLSDEMIAPSLFITPIKLAVSFLIIAIENCVSFGYVKAYFLIVSSVNCEMFLESRNSF